MRNNRSDEVPEDPADLSWEEEYAPQRTHMIDRIWPVFVRIVKWIVIIFVAVFIVRPLLKGCVSSLLSSSTDFPASSASSTKTQDTSAPVTTTSREQAQKRAASYLRSSAFSRSRLIHQLEWEGFSTEDAHGADAVGLTE